MFNKERKEAFIEYSKSVIVRNTNVLATRFMHTADYERALNKDLSEFSYEEISEMFKSITGLGANALSNLRSTCAQYTAWCMESQLAPIGPNLYRRFDIKTLEALSSKKDNEKCIVSEEMLDEWCKKLRNPSEAFVLRGIYEGIAGPGFRELADLTINDINGNVLSLSTGRTLVVSDKLIQLARRAYETEELITLSGRSVLLEENDRILRRRNNTKGDPNCYELVDKRFADALDYLEVKGIRKKFLALSGEISFIKKRSAELGLSVSEYLNSDRIYEVTSRYSGSGSRIGASPNSYIRKNKEYLD